MYTFVYISFKPVWSATNANQVRANTRTCTHTTQTRTQNLSLCVSVWVEIWHILLLVNEVDLKLQIWLIWVECELTRLKGPTPAGCGGNKCCAGQPSAVQKSPIHNATSACHHIHISMNTLGRTHTRTLTHTHFSAWMSSDIYLLMTTGIYIYSGVYWHMYLYIYVYSGVHWYKHTYQYECLLMHTHILSRTHVNIFRCTLIQTHTSQHEYVLTYR